MREYDTSDTMEHIKQKIVEGTVEGEMNEEEFLQKSSELSHALDLAEDVENMKRERMKQVEKDFVDGEIDGDELDRELEKMMESGDDFLDEPEENLVSDEAVFRTIRALVVLGYIFLLIFLLTSIYVTKGLVMLLLIPAGLFVTFYKLGLFK